jgi:heme-degrading monooxygenase HmoA
MQAWNHSNEHRDAQQYQREAKVAAIKATLQQRRSRED